ncbi:MAG: 50S ribosomal protein L3 [Candidatus Nitrosocaldus sp.]|nr:50S ribosomal protein L3 [Candidatus Nitrosocaldus sp.]MDW8275510.1 50S ribosomal protein L3 [Candidatus Nitrosocaldus sp.]
MGHRKHSAPRRGSLAYLPRARAKSIESRIRTWPSIDAKEPRLLGFAGFKAANIHLITIDDRERTPNFGKPLMSRATVIVTPPMRVIGIRAYEKTVYGLRSLFDVYASELPKELARKVKIKPTEQSTLNDIQLDGVHELRALVSVTPRAAGIEQKKPFVFEVGVGGGDIKARFEYLKNLLGKDVRIRDVFKVGEYVDISAITKGKGFEGPVTRWGIKRKQHKSRKSVRAVGTLGPISPATVMYTVPRAGQRGLHQRLEYNKRILMIASTDESNITPKGGFMHFGVLRGDYIVVRGSVAGAVKRLIKLRYAIRPKVKKIVEPKIVEVVA